MRTETGLNVIELDSRQDSKIVRVNAITPKLESKRVRLVQGHWNETFLDQISLFANHKHDDIVDTLVYVVNKLLSGNGNIRWYMWSKSFS